MSEDTCVVCDSELIKKSSGYGFSKYRLLSLTSPYTARRVFPRVSPSPKAHICLDCSRRLTKSTVRVRTRKGTVTRRRWPGPRSPPTSGIVPPLAATPARTPPLTPTAGGGAKRLASPFGTPLLVKRADAKATPLRTASAVKEEDGERKEEDDSWLRQLVYDIKEEDKQTVKWEQVEVEPQEEYQEKVEEVVEEEVEDQEKHPEEEAEEVEEDPEGDDEPLLGWQEERDDEPQHLGSSDDDSGEESDQEEEEEDVDEDPEEPLLGWEDERDQDLGSPDEDSGGEADEDEGEIRQGFRMQAARYLQQRKYDKMFRVLWRNSRGARTSMVAIVGQGICREMTAVTRQQNPKRLATLSQPMSLATLDNFTWRAAVSEANGSLPATMAVLNSLTVSEAQLRQFTTVGRRDGKRKMTEDETTSVRERHIGTLLAILLYRRLPKTYKFMPAAIGIELWRQGCSQKAFQLLHALGVTQTAGAARANVDKIASAYDRQAHAMKEALLSVMPQDDPPPLRRRLDYNDQPPPQHSFSLGWDNVQIAVHRKHQSLEHGNRFMMWAMAFAVTHRVPSLELIDQTTIPAADMAPAVFLPHQEDLLVLRERAEIIVERILTTYLSYFEQLSAQVVWHVRHAHTPEMERTTSVTNLGVIEANPASTTGVLDIMDHLITYVPTTPEGLVHALPCNGDQLSVERMTHAKRGRVIGHTPKDRLEGLIETPQEFHKEGILLQDTLESLFTERSVADVGTLYQLKDRFHHRSVRKKVMDNFQHVWDFVEFTTHGFIVLLAMQLSDMASMADAPGEAEGMDKADFLRVLVRRVVDRLWSAPTAASIRQVTDDYEFCLCRQDKDDEMVQCCSSRCSVGWVHFSCAVPPLVEKPDGDWFCSPTCLRSPSYIYCFCQTRKGNEDDEDMTRCARGEDCRWYERYHRDCLITRPEEPWYCSQECALEDTHDDHIKEYSLEAAWRGLCHLVNRDIVREGDGPAMLSMWRLHLIEFWTNRHPKYVIAAHLLLANTGGGLPERLQHELTWERVANLHGGKGYNIGLDLLNEFLNNDFKEMLRHSGGQYTAKQVDRCSQLGGEFGKSFDATIANSFGVKLARAVTARHDFRRRDVPTMVEELVPHAPFGYEPHREYRAFPGFRRVVEMREPAGLGSRLRELSADYDFWQRRGPRIAARRQRQRQRQD